MNCIRCKINFNLTILYRTKPKGQENYEWICKDCMIAMQIPVPWNGDIDGLEWKAIIQKSKNKKNHLLQ